MESKKIKIVCCVIIVILIAVFSFKAGETVGYNKASFSFGWGENFYRTFGRIKPYGMMSNRMGIADRDDFTGSHNSIGKIIKINLPNLIVEDQDNVEKIVSVATDTLIRYERSDIKPEDLKINESVLVIGSPNDESQIEARLIRVISN